MRLKGYKRLKIIPLIIRQLHNVLIIREKDFAYFVTD